MTCVQGEVSTKILTQRADGDHEEGRLGREQAGQSDVPCVESGDDAESAASDTDLCVPGKCVSGEENEGHATK